MDKEQLVELPGFGQGTSRSRCSVSSSRTLHIAAPSRPGWYQLELVPHNLGKPVFALLFREGGSGFSPIAYFSFGPVHPVRRAIYHSGGDADYSLEAFIGPEVQGDVVAQFSPLNWRTYLSNLAQKISRLVMRGSGLFLRAGEFYNRTVRSDGPAPVIPVGAPRTTNQWIEKFALPSQDAATALKVAAQAFDECLIIIDVRTSEAANLSDSHRAIANQYFVNPRVLQLDGNMSASDLTKALAPEKGVVFWLEAGDAPRDLGLTCLGRACGEGHVAVFGDWLETKSAGNSSIKCGPGWDRIAAEAGFEIRAAVAFYADALREALSGINDNALPTRHDLLLLLDDVHGEPSIGHIPLPLSTVRKRESVGAPPISLGLEAPPLVSLIVPTHSKADLLRKCVQTCFIQNSYEPIELVVIDHNSSGSEMSALLAEISSLPNTQIIREGGAFNFSRLVNVGASRSMGDILVFLNDDVEAISTNWLFDMVAFAVRPEIGAVGARLFYPDGRLQHDGIVIGMSGIAGHPGRLTSPPFENPDPRSEWAHRVSAVTGACLAVKRSAFESVGGFNEQLAIEYNDVDFCLRLCETDLRNVMVPSAQLRHHENATRQFSSYEEAAPQKTLDKENFVMQWGHLLGQDRWVSACISLDNDGCGLSDSPRLGPIIIE